ncbi:hypothetical protein T310_2538 [Rasamsonia emersonii CBS 393.64]|uniref:Uncharacterized protein n=1 Tax=Rasamsonia emersonii (strain ATCC 16479 / CBS 393.64 / IMI 116815) TaxID=1408163 RepID=A0A0F4YYV0_RASE3|nr:hypothetical protein T310_2538 [Rasamsonia emersonii CBS 393.64]KKA23472.1 hypothetical protein T310_2538 [Rasamsonia emersonii CBS 393.64]
MPRAIKYKYVTTDGLPPLDGLPPELAFAGEQGLALALALGRGQRHEEYGYGVRTASAIGNGNDNSNGNGDGHQSGCPLSSPPPPPYCPADPPPPYMPTQEQQPRQPQRGTTRTADRGRCTGDIQDPVVINLNMGTNHHHHYHCHCYCHSSVPLNNAPTETDTDTILFQPHTHICTYPPTYSHYPPPSSLSSISGNSHTQQGGGFSCSLCQSHQIPTAGRNSPTAALPIGSIMREIPLMIPFPFSSSGTQGDPVMKPNLDLGLGLGFGYIFPEHHTTIHLIEPEYLPFNHHQDHQSRPFRFCAYNVATSLTVAEFMRRACFYHHHHRSGKHTGIMDPGAAGDRVYAYCITECIELGDGRWGRGQEFCIAAGGGDRCLQAEVQSLTLADVGWDETRATKPVWIATTVVWQ